MLETVIIRNTKHSKNSDDIDKLTTISRCVWVIRCYGAY